MAFLEKLDIFQQNPGLLDKYLIGSEASLAVLDLFLTRLFGNEGLSAVVDAKEAVELVMGVRDLSGVEERKSGVSEKSTPRSDEHWAVVEELKQQVLDLTQQFSALQRQVQGETSQLAASLEDRLDEVARECERRVAEADEALRAEIRKVDESSRDVAHGLEELKNELELRARADDMKKLEEDVSILKETEMKLDGLISAGSAMLVGCHQAMLAEIQGKIEKINMKSDPLDGIIAHLTREYGGNVHEKNVVRVTASDLDFDWRRAENVVDLGSDWIFCSGYSPNQWICYDFIDRRVIPTSYSVRSMRKGPGNEHPKSWVLEVSDDSIMWKVVDSREDNSDLNHNYVTRNFELNSPLIKAFRFVRLRLTGENHYGNHQLIIAALELFGALSSE